MLICQPSSRVVNLLFSIEEKLKLRIASSSVPLCKWVMASFHPELSKTVKENVIAVTCVVYCYFPTGLKPFSRFLSFKCHEIIDCLRYWWINSPIVFAFQQYLFIRVTPVREHQLENFIIRDLNIRLNRYQSVFFIVKKSLWFSSAQFGNGFQIFNLNNSHQLQIFQNWGVISILPVYLTQRMNS